MAEVDWLIDQFALALDERDAQIAALRARLPAHPGPAGGSKDGQETAPDDDDAAVTEDEEPPHA
jgi:hypothetical protein